MPIKNWSTTAASNNSAPPNGAPEGMAPSTVNDIIRQQMADHRTQWQDGEWFDWGDTPSRNAAGIFKVAADVTSRYLAGRRIKCYDGSTFYGMITSSSYSAPDTTINVTLDSGALTTSLSSVALAILSPTNKSMPTYDLDTVTVSGAAQFKGTMTASGAAVFKTTVTVEGASTFSGASVFKTTATFEGAAVFKTTMSVEGASTLSGAAVFKSTATFEAAAVFKSTVSVDGAATISGAATFKSTTTHEAAAVFKTSATIEGELSASATAVFNTGIKLGAGSLLSTYIKWTTFTPTVTLVGGAGNTVPQYTTNTGRYCQIGSTVFVDVVLNGDGGNEGAGTGDVNVAMPATVSTTAGNYINDIGYYANGATIDRLWADIGASGSTIYLTKSTLANFTGADQNNATRTIRLHFNYEAA